MKYLLLLLIVCLYSCDPRISSSIPYTVKTITMYGDNGRCCYHLSTGQSYFFYSDNIKFVDSIGKFNLCDTIYLKIEK